MAEPVSPLGGLLKLAGAAAKERGFLTSLLLAGKLRGDREKDTLSEYEIVRRLNPGRHIEVRIENGSPTIVPTERVEPSFRGLPVPEKLAEGGDALALSADPDLRLWESYMQSGRKDAESTGAVLGHAADEIIRQADLGNEASEAPVGETWMSRFLDSARLVRDSDLQEAWGRLLAGEVISPGRFSFRTLQILEAMSSDDAALWNRAVSLSIRSGRADGPSWGFIPKAWAVRHDSLFSLHDASQLVHIGLLSPEGVSYKTPHRAEAQGLEPRMPLYLNTSPHRIVAWTPDNHAITEYAIHPFTPSGLELAGMVYNPTDLDHAREAAAFLHSHGANVAVYEGTGRYHAREPFPREPVLVLTHDSEDEARKYLDRLWLDLAGLPQRVRRP